MTKHVTETSLVAANEIDAALELSLTTVWDAKVYSWDNSKYPFNEWILDRIRGMGYDLNDSELFARDRPAQGSLHGHQAALRRYQPARVSPDAEPLRARSRSLLRANCGFRSPCSVS